MPLLGPVQTEPRGPAGGYMARVAPSPANSWFLFPPEYQLTVLETKSHMLPNGREDWGERAWLSAKQVISFLGFCFPYRIWNLSCYLEDSESPWQSAPESVGHIYRSAALHQAPPWAPGPRTQTLPPRSLQCSGQGWRKVSHEGQVRSQGGRGGSNQERLCERLCGAHPSHTCFHLSSPEELLQQQSRFTSRASKLPQAHKFKRDIRIHQKNIL